MLKKTIYFIGIMCLGWCLSFGYKALPILHEFESYKTLFEKNKLEKIAQFSAKPWEENQLSQDFKEFEAQTITSDRVDLCFKEIEKKAGRKEVLFHYRILDNKLYKFVPNGGSTKDISFEKAIKTLCHFVKVPDVDFIYCAMDGVCESYMPENFHLAQDLETQVPILAAAKLKNTPYVVLIPDHLSVSENWANRIEEVEKLNKTICWEDKNEVGFWRGGISDIGVPQTDCPKEYKTTPRYLICQLSKDNPDQIDAGFNIIEPEKLAQILAGENITKPSASIQDHLNYKYLPVLDGHMCTYPGYQWRLLSNSVAIKQESNQIQWFYSALTPFIHYIPVENYLSDLNEKLKWAKENDQKVQQIVKNAQSFARENLKMEDLYHYLLLTLQKYSTYQTIDFKKLKAETKLDPHWRCIQYRKQLHCKKVINSINKFIFNNKKTKSP